MSDPDPAVVYPDEASARALHEQVELIARRERRYIAGMAGFGALVFLVLALAAAWAGSTSNAAGFSGAFGAALADWLYLRFTRPRSVKPWDQS